MTDKITASEYRKSLKPGKSKYGNKKVKLHGEVFDSKKEMRRWEELSILQKAGLITDLKRQVQYILIPARYADVNGKKKCIEKSCSYYADFVYKDCMGEFYVEDTKGVRTASYIIKKKLMLHIHGIQIKEV